MGPEIEGKRERPKEKKEMSLGEVEEYKEKLTEMVEKAREIAKNEKEPIIFRKEDIDEISSQIRKD